MNYKGENGRSALHMASARGQADLVEFFVDQPDCNLDLFDSNGMTALMLGVQSKNMKTVVTLINGCANPFLHNRERKSALDLTTAEPRPYNTLMATLIESSI